MIERAHEMPPQFIAPLVAEVIAAIGGRDVTVYLQDYTQSTLVPLTGTGLVVGDVQPIDDSPAGGAFLSDTMTELTIDGGVRMFVPLLGGTERVGVLAFTAHDPSADDRRLARRFAGLVADVMVAKGGYTDRFFQARRQYPVSLSAELQWSLLPPLMMNCPQVSVAGILEPAYDVAGDSFDYALNDDVLQVAIIDAMGHGLDAAVMASVAVAAYRHARRADHDLLALYAAMNHAILEQFDVDRFVTALLACLDVTTGRLSWLNAGHPRPLLVRGGRFMHALRSPTALPIGIGESGPRVTDETLQPGDRVLFFTDGIIEERLRGGEQFGDSRLVELLEQAERQGGPVQQTVRRLSHALMAARGGSTSDDATLFLLEWRGGADAG
jgi:hypothetical protein